MTLDDGYLNQAEMLRRDKERDDEARREYWAEVDARESVEAMEAHWAGIMAASAEGWQARQHWDGT